MTDPKHAAYRIANKAIRAAKLDAVSQFFNQIDCYDPKDPDDISMAVRITEQAFDLCYQADKIARQMLGSHTHDLAIAELSRRRPGYSPDTYTQAIAEAFTHAAR